MKPPELPFTPFTHLTELNNDIFLVVHHLQVERSEVFDKSLFDGVERKGDFFSFSYKHIFAETKILSGNMLESGFVNQKLVPIVTSNPFDLILSVLGLWMNHSIPVPLNIQLLKSDLQKQIEFLHSEHIICENIYFDDFPFLKKFSAPRASISRDSINLKSKSSDTAVVLFTSGTSGKPKAVPLSYWNLSTAFTSGNALFNYSKNDSWYLNLPLYHIGGFSILTRALLAGSSIVLTDSNELDSLKRNMNNLKPSLVSLVPTQLIRICERNIQPNREMRAALIGGGFADNNLLYTAIDLGWKIHKVYGSTETSAFITTLSPDDLKRKPKSVGKPLESVAIKIFDDKKNALPINEVGEIGVNADSVFDKYLFNEEDSISSFHDNYFLTGDFGYLDSEGYLYLESRRTDLIVSGGENISPIEIENVISQFQNIDEVCVFGQPDKEWGEIVAAAVKTKNKTRLSIPELTSFMKERLPSFKVPKRYFEVGSFPKSALGKIKRAEVKELFRGSTSTHT